MRHQLMTRACLLLAFSLVAWLLAASSVDAKPKDGKAQPTEPADYRSDHFYLHTDLSPAGSQELLERLETMLDLISTYWARPCLGLIECYVVDDLASTRKERTIGSASPSSWAATGSSPPRPTANSICAAAITGGSWPTIKAL